MEHPQACNDGLSCGGESSSIDARVCRCPGDEVAAERCSLLCIIALSYMGFHFLTVLVSSLLSGSKLKEHAALAEWEECQATRRRAGTYVASLIHSLIAAGSALALLWQYGLLGSNIVQANQHMLDDNNAGVGTGLSDAIIAKRLIAVSAAYFFEDLIATMPDWRCRKEDVVHHLVGLALTISCLCSDRIARVGAHILITELSTPFINLMWLSHKYPHGWIIDADVVNKASAAAFVLAFFVTRIVYLPCVTFVAWMYLRDGLVRHAPQIGIGLLLLCVLNFYWFHRIILMVVNMFGGGSRKGTSTGATKPEIDVPQAAVLPSASEPVVVAAAATVTVSKPEVAGVSSPLTAVLSSGSLPEHILTPPRAAEAGDPKDVYRTYSISTVPDILDVE